MSWLQVDLDLATDRDLLRLGRALGVPAYTATGLLIGLWSHVFRHAPDGILVDYEPDDIEAVIRWEGDDGALAEALMRTGWLIQTEDGLVVRGWDRYREMQEAREKTREKDRRRKRDQRASERSPVDSEGRPSESARTPPESSPKKEKEKEKEKKTKKENQGRQALLEPPAREPVRARHAEPAGRPTAADFGRIWNEVAAAVGCKPVRLVGDDALDDNGGLLLVVEALVAQGWTLERWRAHVDRVAASSWCRGAKAHPRCRPWSMRTALDPAERGAVERGERDDFERKPPHDDGGGGGPKSSSRAAELRRRAQAIREAEARADARESTGRPARDQLERLAASSGGQPCAA